MFALLCFLRSVTVSIKLSLGPGRTFNAANPTDSLTRAKVKQELASGSRLHARYG
jgi:hypothetical protein